jgi:hypothetical protein
LDLRLETKEIVDAINSLHSAVSRQDWGSATRAAFVASLGGAISSLKELEGRFRGVARELGKSGAAGAPDLGDLMQEFGKSLTVLENNLRLEKSKKSRARESNIHEREENSELYSELSQRVETLLLRARYMAERLSVFALRQSSAPLEGKSTARQMLDLLQAKEKEIEELKGKYEDVRRKSYLGLVQERTSADLEEELGELSVKLGGLASELGHNIAMHRNHLEYIENSYAELKQRLDSMEETFNGYVEKSLELIALLKKERDYAKKVVLDIEHETLQLRNAYTAELLALQENKLGAKREAEEKLGKEIRLLKKQLKEKEELLVHFRKMAEEKAGKEKTLEEKVKRLTLLLKTKEKHEAVKRHFRRRAKRKRK